MRFRKILFILMLLITSFIFSFEYNSYNSAISIPESEISTRINRLESVSSYFLTLDASNLQNNELKEGYTTIIAANLTPADETAIFHWTINGENIETANGSNEIYAWTVFGNVITITANTKSKSLNIVCYASVNGNESITVAQNAIVINLISRDSTTSEIISSILNNTTVISVGLLLAASVLCKVAIKIFNIGVNYKSNFASVKQQKEFESSIREELRSAKSEIQESVLKSSIRIIERETAPLKELKSIQDEVKNTKISIDMQLKSVGERYEDLRKTADTVRELEKRINNIQYGDSEPSRRSGK